VAVEGGLRVVAAEGGIHSVPCRWGLKVDLVINEHTAATIAYGMEETGGESNILVFDLSGGTFDVTLLTINNGVFEVHTTNGDTHQGGKDFDQRVMQYFIKMIKKKSNIDKTVGPVGKVIEDTDVSKSEVEEIVPVGGSTRIPKVGGCGQC
jgi:molecular chaperone DnaK (HSP70)